MFCICVDRENEILQVLIIKTVNKNLLFYGNPHFYLAWFLYHCKNLKLNKNLE